MKFEDIKNICEDYDNKKICFNVTYKDANLYNPVDSTVMIMKLMINYDILNDEKKLTNALRLFNEYVTFKKVSNSVIFVTNKMKLSLIRYYGQEYERTTKKIEDLKKEEENQL